MLHTLQLVGLDSSTVAHTSTSLSLSLALALALALYPLSVCGKGLHRGFYFLSSHQGRQASSTGQFGSWGHVEIGDPWMQPAGSIEQKVLLLERVSSG